MKSGGCVGSTGISSSGSPVMLRTMRNSSGSCIAIGCILSSCHESDVPLFSSTHSQPVTTFALMDIQTDTTIHMYSKDMSIILERVVFVV
jgi:hypothetical protein